MKGGYDASRFVEFINGMSLAGSLSGGTSTDRLDIHFMDIGNDNSAEKLASIKAILDADIILGGYQTSQVKALAEIALSKAIPYISLWNSSDDIVNHNPYFSNETFIGSLLLKHGQLHYKAIETRFDHYFCLRERILRMHQR